MKLDLRETSPLPRWCFLDTDGRWEAYPELVSDEIERLLSFSRKKLLLAPQILSIIDFDKMEVYSIRKYSKDRRIIDKI